MDERELEKMKREAEKRMNDMHSRAQSEKSPEPPAEESKPSSKEALNTPPERKPAAEKDNVFSVLMKDKDRTIILGLLLLLMDEGGDQSLILALLYLLL